MRLKPETIRDALSVLDSAGRVSAHEFSKSYWPGRFTDGRPATRAATQFLFRLRKMGLVTVFQRRQGWKELYMVYEVSPLGYQFLQGDLKIE